MDCENSVEGVGSKAGWPQPIDLFPAALCHMPLTAKPHLLTLLLRDFWGASGEVTGERIPAQNLEFLCL